MLRKSVIKVIVFGTFDILHQGHLNFFKQAKNFGDFLIVVVARDCNIRKIKKQASLYNEKTRLETIKMYRLKNRQLIDKVILGGKEDKFLVLKREKPDIVCLGYDQQVDKRKLKEKLKEYGLLQTRIVRLQSYHPEIYKSSKLRKIQKQDR